MSVERPEAERLEAEATAFDARIRERVAAGLIPDLRRAVKCDYFYKSFWRDPHSIDLYLGEVARTLLDLLARHGRPGLRILDVGCGLGYYSLELARAGYHVLGIDISGASIDVARATLAANPYRDGFGSLRYETIPFHKATGEFDVVMFTGALHHFPELGPIVRQTREHLPRGGLVLCYEPCHDQWRVDDAAQVALIRSLLSLTGHWYEAELADSVRGDPAALGSFFDEVRREYVEERDKHEAGQSPSDNASTGAEILDALRGSFEQLEYRPGSSFIYRLLGGLRGPDEVVHRIADLLALYDRVAVYRGVLRPNLFFFLGTKAG